ncbi:MED6-domain-containing protein [Boletus coccyginus]|nr:MED6-domain-containing protein [Boletus coccyginus]
MMDDRDLHPSDDYSHRFFIWHEWIQAHGPLSTENVFDYFAASMFYDKQSNNQVLRMQTMHTGTPILNEAEELRRFTGIEFALAHASPPSLFIIHKRERLSPDQVRPLAAYFIINSRIYQSPDVYTLLSNRLLTSLNALQSSLDFLRKHRPDYTPRSGFVWPIIDSSSPVTPPEKPDLDVLLPDHSAVDAPEKLKHHGPKKHQNNLLMMYAMRTTAVHSNITSSRSQPLAHDAVDSAPASVLATASAHPAPTHASSAQRPPTPKVPSTAPSPQDTAPIKGPVGAGKKKKKRTSVLAT